MSQLIAIVGRPNVGKSTLFNRLTRRWSSIVEDREGITRDRLYGTCLLGGHEFTLMDTGGLQLNPKAAVEKKMSDQAMKGIAEADLILFVMDGRDGVTSMDQEWVQRIRKIKKPKLFLVNKLDVQKMDVQAQSFHELGIDPILPMSFEKQRNFDLLEDSVLTILKLEQKPYQKRTQDSDESLESIEDDFSVAIIGRPNVGKSTLLNALLNEERCIVDDVPGTTRDPIHMDIEHAGKMYRFIDTAGIRKRAKSVERVEKFSVMAALNVMRKADLSLLLIDSIQGPTEQDAHVAGYAFEKHKALILIVNKWDLGKENFTQREFESKMELKMNYLQDFPVLYISAKTGKNLQSIFSMIEIIRDQYERKIKTGELNRAFEQIVEHHPLPVYKGQSIKMYYATQVSTKPPTFIVFCNYPEKVHFSYQRYLINALREHFDLKHVPVRVVFKKR